MPRRNFEAYARPPRARPAHDENRTGVIGKHSSLEAIPTMHDTNATTCLRQGVAKPDADDTEQRRQESFPSRSCLRYEKVELLPHTDEAHPRAE